MSHPNHCGKICSECTTSCALDESMPCSPDCIGLNQLTGEHDSPECKSCPAITNNI